MLSMIMSESRNFAITTTQFADLNVLDMVVPGSIAINAATYVGYLHQGLPGAIAATIGVSLPSFVMTVLIMRLFVRFEESLWLHDILSGIKPAAVGLIAAAAITIAMDVLTAPGMNISTLWSNPIGTLSWVGVGIFAVAAVLNIKFDINPILLTVLAGVVGAVIG